MSIPRAVLVTLLAATLAVPALEITEVYPNPEGRDNTKEFVELNKHPGRNALVGDGESNDTLTLVQNGTAPRVVIAEDGYNASNVVTVYTAGATIGNGLANGGDTVYIFGATNDSVSYEETEEGVSLQREGSEFVTAKPTPGKPLNPTCNVSLTTSTMQDRLTYPPGSTAWFTTAVNGVDDFTVQHVVSSTQGSVFTVVNQSRSTEQSIALPNVDTRRVVTIASELISPDCDAHDTTKLIVRPDGEECTTYKRRIDKLSDKLTNLQYLLSEQPRVEYVCPVVPNITSVDVEVGTDVTTLNVSVQNTSTGSLRAFQADSVEEENLRSHVLNFSTRSGNTTYVVVVENATRVFDTATVTTTVSKNSSDSKGENPTEKTTVNVSERIDAIVENTTERSSVNMSPSTGRVIYTNRSREDVIFFGSVAGSVVSALYGVWELVTESL